MGESLESIILDYNKVDELFRDITIFVTHNTPEDFAKQINLNELSEIERRRISFKFKNYIDTQAQNIQEKELILNNLIQVGLLRCSGVVKKDKHFYIFTFIDNNEDIRGSSFFVETEEELGIKIDTVSYTGNTMHKLAQLKKQNHTEQEKENFKGLQYIIDNPNKEERNPYGADSFYLEVQDYFAKHASELFHKGINNTFIEDIEYRLKTLYNNEEEIDIISMFNDVKEIYEFLDYYGINKFENRIAHTNIANIQNSIPNTYLESQGHIYELLKLYLRPVYKD